MVLFTEQFSNDSCKTNTKVITATNQNSAINQSEFVAITHNLLRSQEKSCTQGATGFDFACHWFNLNWHKIFSQSLSVAIALLCYYFQRSFENCSNRG